MLQRRERALYGAGRIGRNQTVRSYCRVPPSDWEVAQFISGGTREVSTSKLSVPIACSSLKSGQCNLEVEKVPRFRSPSGYVLPPDGWPVRMVSELAYKLRSFPRRRARL